MLKATRALTLEQLISSLEKSSPVTIMTRDKETQKRKLYVFTTNMKNTSRERHKMKNATTTTRESGMHSDELSATLERHDVNYGRFYRQGIISQQLKQDFRSSAGGEGWLKLANDQRETLDMMANKISRILNGNPNIFDHWFDLAGYAMLIANRLKENE